MTKQKDFVRQAMNRSSRSVWRMSIFWLIAAAIPIVIMAIAKTHRDVYIMISCSILILGLLCMMTRFIIKKSQANESLKQIADAMNISKEELIDIVNKDFQESKILFQNKFIVFTNTWILLSECRFYLLPTNWIIWILYQLRDNGGSTKKISMLTIYTVSEKKPIRLSMLTKKFPKELPSLLDKACSDAFYGENATLQRFSKDTAQLVAYWDQKKSTGEVDAVSQNSLERFLAE